jgi:uncharacterized protein (TIGR03083 family)
MMGMTNVNHFTRASHAFIDVVAQIGPEQWGQPGLGSWDVRSLVGHTTRAILTVENYLARDEPDQAAIPTAEMYYTTIYELTDPQAVAERGVEAGIALGDDPVTFIRAADIRARALIEAQHRGRLVSIGGLGIPLDEYLRTRVFELVAHTLDVARATGATASIPEAPVACAVTLAAGIAAAAGHGEEVLLALTGRQPLPEGFSVL